MANDEWYTPEPLVKDIDKYIDSPWLDPVGSSISPAHAHATLSFSENDDSLLVDWEVEECAIDKHLGLFMNPPYSKPKEFINKAISFQQRDCGQRGVVLVNAATSTKWCQKLLKAADFACFVSPRIRYLRQRKKPTEFHPPSHHAPASGWVDYRNRLAAEAALPCEYSVSLNYPDRIIELVQPSAPRYENLIVGFKGATESISVAYEEFHNTFSSHGVIVALTV
jgi:phage N-6-adenine-methyltransferase